MSAEHGPAEPSPPANPSAPPGTEIEADGGLFNRGEYMDWAPTGEKIRLDGEFTPDQLIWIAEHMKSNRKAE
jgi:hypothetical protein